MPRQAKNTGATARRGRPPSFYNPDVSEAHVASVAEQSVPLSENLSADKGLAPKPAPDINAEIARIRQIRRPLGTYAQKLALDRRPGYHRHWFNDQPGRVDEAVANGWAHVADREGKPLKRVVGSGRDRGALYAYAMEIPEVFWQEDMAARHADAQSRVDAIRQSPFRAKQGETTAQDQGKFYSPKEEPLQVMKA